MTKKLFIIFISGFLFNSCRDIEKTESNVQVLNENKWNLQKLKDKAIQHHDSSKWGKKLFNQDIENYNRFTEIFNSYPINKSPFPVAKYDYAVSSIPFTIKKDTLIFKGVRIGEYENPESEKVNDKLTLLILTNDKDSEENTLVESRNYPYLTAQGIFKLTNNDFDWVFSASPDGYSILLINMKLFDLRFGETIIIYPQLDKSFLYDQLEESPNNYENFEDFKKVILKNLKFKLQPN